MGTVPLKKDKFVKLTISATTLLKFEQEGWFEIILPMDARTNIDVIKKGALVRLSTNSRDISICTLAR